MPSWASAYRHAPKAGRLGRHFDLQFFGQEGAHLVDEQGLVQKDAAAE